ncbi:methylated-DNA--[protein]-cysteine S-methyltransferase [Phytoactinopolyspora halotolerans]|uniref:Methylated-DNA--protein-cysteine methyltransferase n=1 Tax=Phytoactinopolyspora halotolerans TaxID=1981512 RepID=A0A6L9SE27_9ACTN|nr:methylated-DNA--[protein]-cysteine S-methyltransferase [Phytoactinopolyspora halotolerans]NEE03367.1 methylated-DNA--[protein]-cysteine S-methyltransferase [Phytoactinopolyspora halotolerans]
MEADDVAVAGLDTPVGALSVAVTSVGVASVGWGMPERLAGRAGLPVVDDAERVAPVVDQLVEYFDGARRVFEVPVDWRYTSGTQRTVLEALHAGVPYGTSVTYGQLAERSGTTVPARGIGSIMGSNPIPVIVPCHRVLAHDGLGGYSGGAGIEIKRWLLALEGVLPPTLDFSPDTWDTAPVPRSG